MPALLVNKIMHLKPLSVANTVIYILKMLLYIEDYTENVFIFYFTRDCRLNEAPN